MDKAKRLQEIFENDPLGLLNIKALASPAQNEDGRLVASFLEINDFYEKNNRKPLQGGGIQEHQLYARLKSLREHTAKIDMLLKYDTYNLLTYQQKQINSMADILHDDGFSLLDDDYEGLFDLKHITPQDDRASADFVARRKPCKEFGKYESLFKEVQKDLSESKRKLIQFKEDNLREGAFYVHNGILLLLDKVNFEEEIQAYRSGSRVRKDGRTKVIFENGTQSNMLYRSLYKSLLANGNAVSENIDKVNENFMEKFSNINDEDKEAGYIYILKSKSEKQEIREIHNLYKIGFSKITVEERVKNAFQEPTYLMAAVHIVMAYKCFNMNPQKMELLLHNFFGNSCINIDIFDKNGMRHTPREWFIAPLDIIERTIHMIITGEIINWRYDANLEDIISR